MLTEVRERLLAEGNRVTTERQNSFRLRGSSGAIISGQPDLIVIDADGQAPYSTSRPERSETRT